MQALIITQSIVMVLLILLIIFLIRQRRVAKFEKRFASFALNGNLENEMAISDSFTNDTFSLLRKISTKLAKIPLYQKWSNLFAKYPIFTRNSKLNPADFLTLKFLLMIYLLIFLILVDIFRGLDITIFHYLFWAILIFTIPNLFLILLNQQRNKILKNDIYKIMGMINNELEHNDNLVEVISIVKNEVTGPMSEELALLEADIRHGISIDKAMERMYMRTHINLLDEIAIFLLAITKTTGEKKVAFKYLNERLKDLQQHKEESKIYYYFARLMSFLGLLIPPILFIVYRFIWPDAFAILTGSYLGYMNILMFWLVYILYYLLLKFIMDGGSYE